MLFSYAVTNEKAAVVGLFLCTIFVWDMTVSQAQTEPKNRPEENGTEPADSADSVVYPVTGSIYARITPEKTGCTITVPQKDTPVYSRVCRTDPWDSPKIQSEIINGSFPKLDPDRHPDKDRYKTAFLNLFGRIKRDIAANPLMKRMLSETLVQDLTTGTDPVKSHRSQRKTPQRIHQGPGRNQ